jgi:filamentous hemagglutinin family protein
MGNLSNTELCSDAQGILAVLVADTSKIDWDNVTFDITDTEQIAAFAYTDGASATPWVEFTFNRKSGRLDGIYTLDNGYYEVNLTNMIFNGVDSKKSLKIDQMITACGLVALIYLANGSAVLVGKEHISNAWVDPLETVRISRNNFTSGAYGDRDDRIRNEVDLSGQHQYSPLFLNSSLDLATMRADVDTAA